jgi:hypothetical protein
MFDDLDASVTSYSIDDAILTSLASTSNLVFSYNKFKNPRSTNKACSSFTVTVTTSAGNTIESGSGGSITVATSNSLATFQITASPSSLTNGQTAAYIISSTPNSDTAFLSGDKYYITFPTEIDISGVSCSTISCSLDSGSIIFSIPSDGLSPVALTINNLVVQGNTQPITTTVQVSVTTSSSSSQVISTHSTTTVPTTTTAGTFVDPDLTQSSYIASDTGVIYTFTLTPANDLVAGNVILIRNTPGLTFSLDSGCTAGSATFEVCTFVSAVSGVQAVVNQTISAGSSFTISIGSYTNPAAPTSTSFRATSYVSTSRTFLIDNLATDLQPSLE